MLRTNFLLIIFLCYAYLFKPLDQTHAYIISSKKKKNQGAWHKLMSQ